MKSILITISLISTAVVGSVIIDDISPKVESTVSTQSLTAVLKNAVLLANYGDLSPVLTSFNESSSHSENLFYNDETVKFTIGETCYVGTLTNNKTDYNISVC